MSMAEYTIAKMSSSDPTSGNTSRFQKLRHDSNSVARKYQTQANPVMA